MKKSVQRRILLLLFLLGFISCKGAENPSDVKEVLNSRAQLVKLTGQDSATFASLVRDVFPSVTGGLKELDISEPNSGPHAQPTSAIGSGNTVLDTNNVPTHKIKSLFDFLAKIAQDLGVDTDSHDPNVPWPPKLCLRDINIGTASADFLLLPAQNAFDISSNQNNQNPGSQTTTLRGRIVSILPNPGTSETVFTFQPNSGAAALNIVINPSVASFPITVIDPGVVVANNSTVTVTYQDVNWFGISRNLATRISF